MATLTLDPEQVASERQVILEEIAMYDSEPWDALEMAVHDRLFAGHPYGQPGARHPRGAAGDRRRGAARLPPPLLPAGQRHPGGGGGHRRRRSRRRPAGARRHPRRRRAAPRLQPAHRAPHRRRAAGAPQGGGRAPAPGAPRSAPARTPITRPCAWRPPCSAAAAPAACSTPWSRRSSSASGCRPTSPRGWTPAMMTVTAEVVPGVDPARVEARVFELLAELRTNPPGAEEVERCRQIAVADWVFGHEKVHQQALSVGLALALFDLEYLDLHLERPARHRHRPACWRRPTATSGPSAAPSSAGRCRNRERSRPRSSTNGSPPGAGTPPAAQGADPSQQRGRVLLPACRCRRRARPPPARAGDRRLRGGGRGGRPAAARPTRTSAACSAAPRATSPSSRTPRSPSPRPSRPSTSSRATGW